MSLSKSLFSALLVLVLTPIGQAFAGLDEDVAGLQSRWAEINYRMEGDDQVKAFEILIDTADQVTDRYPDRAESWIWSAIIKSTYAGARSGLGALKYAKKAKRELERAIELDDKALQGSAYTSLGSLYYNVPGWPVGFGDDKKAEELLKQALAINPDGIDSNYFYGDFLIDQKRYKEAREYLVKASQAAPRPGRQLADEGRQKEISDDLAKVDEETK